MYCNVCRDNYKEYLDVGHLKYSTLGHKDIYTIPGNRSLIAIYLSFNKSLKNRATLIT